jgi:hypothetical protein
MSDILSGVLGGGITAGGSLLQNWQNVKFQQEQNQITRDREDNAVQRRAADMQAAGINPLMAAGSPAATGVMQAPQMKSNVAGDAIEGARRTIDISQTAAAARLTSAQAKSVEIDNDLKQIPRTDRRVNPDGSINVVTEEEGSAYGDSKIRGWEADYQRYALEAMQSGRQADRFGNVEGVKDIQAQFDMNNKKELLDIEKKMKLMGATGKEIENAIQQKIKEQATVSTNWQTPEKWMNVAKLVGEFLKYLK